jgi:hypothetical protein
MKDTSKHFKIGVLIALRSSRRFTQSYLIMLFKYFLFFSKIIILIALILHSRNRPKLVQRKSLKDVLEIQIVRLKVVKG